MNDLLVHFQYGVPPFRMALPPGWKRRATTSETERAELRRGTEIFRQAGRPDLEAQYRLIVAQAHQGMARAKVFAVFRQEDVELDELLPMSMTASMIEGDDGATLDGWIADAFRAKGAEFLEDARHIVRWRNDAVAPPGIPELETVDATTLTYVLPVPGSERRRALVMTTTILAPDVAVMTAEALSALETLSDLMVSTITWERAQAEPAVPVNAAAEEER